jgi:hypothetical protein
MEREIGGHNESLSMLGKEQGAREAPPFYYAIARTRNELPAAKFGDRRYR